ncbi:hypothetical protein Ccrd_009658 [Cynara cardunculus var. scolymus]|uniref:Uncharacterized protein n=1 Tax=Cynara cardunculus var. scolymus TaxID=59895 RepID=A0A103YMN5_CYNCS|nr:hypothetical protein Ccrd_009658 [Cynara cardunculus var. scolymus]
MVVEKITTTDKHTSQQHTQRLSVSTIKCQHKYTIERRVYTLQAITVLSLLPNNIENRVDQLSAFGIVSFGPVITGTTLTKYEIIRPEDLSVGTRSETVHRTWLQIHEHRAWDKPSAAGLVVINIDPLELEFRVSGVLTSYIDTVLGAYDLPELGSDLVTALAALDVKDLTHFRV